MSLNPIMENQLRGPSPMVAHLVRIDLSPDPVYIYDGPGAISYDGKTYLGEDPDFGTLNGIDVISEQIGTEAPTASFSFLPNSIAAMARISAPINQGSPVYIWLATIDQETGLIAGEPHLLFLGELDTADVTTDEITQTIDFNVASAWERFFENSEGQRLNNTFIQLNWPGARGAEFITQIQREEPWGYDGPRPNIVADVIGGSPGGGGMAPNPGGGSGGSGGGGRSGGGDYSNMVY